MDINVVSENFIELLTNSVNMTEVFYDLFLNPTPMDVTLQQYNSNNQLIEVTIPNRAKDKQISLSGVGSPEGVVSAVLGVTYVDTLDQIVYFKTSNSGGNTGWTRVLTAASIQPFLNDYVKKETTINNKPLTSSINLTASDVGALDNSTEYGRKLSAGSGNLSIKLLDQSDAEISSVNYLPSAISGGLLSVRNNGSSNELFWDTTNSVITLPSASSITLETNKMYSLDLTQATTITLPSANSLDTNVFNQILVQLSMNPAVTISHASIIEYFYGVNPNLSSAGNYNLIYEFNSRTNNWVFGAIFKNSI